MRSLGCLIVLTALLASRGGAAVPASKALGDVTEFTRDGNGFLLRTSTGAVVQVQILRSDLFRIRVGPDGTLTDEGSQAAPIVVDTVYSPANARLDSAADHYAIATGDFVLVINRVPLRFALYRPDGKTLIWRELKPLHLAEDGSYQTLSSSAEERFFGGGQQNGSFEFKGRIMEISYSDGWEEGDRPNPAPFYMSSLGYGVLRNTWSDGRYDFWSNDYLTTMHKEHRFDAYYFVGPSIAHVLDLYTQLTGRAGLLPRWAFEYGDADCYNDRDNADKPGTVPPGWTDGPTGTTPDVITTVAAKYREYDMPGGWILPNDGYGCGYTDLPKVVEELNRYGFHTGLWTESGIDKIAWEVGQAGTRVQKLDVAWTGKGYQFALDANMEAARGILNNSDSRPFVWTVMGWAGIQRYAVTWTGDQSGSWDYIRWHVPTLIGSGLSGMVYSTGDVDGIYGGSPETFTRDLQWKCFTPVLMGMSGWSKAERKHPWWFDEPYRSINRKYLKLKMRLLPYMYTLAREAEQTGAPIVRGLSWDHADDSHAFDQASRYEFLLGRDLLVAPVFRSQAASGGWRDSVYLPAGEWVDFWDGTVLRAGADGLYFDYPVTLDRLPVFVRSGAILPLYPETLFDGQVAKDVLTLDVYPQGESEFTLYEDDGNTRAYKNGEFTLQRFHVSRRGAVSAAIEVSLEPVQGRFEGMGERRQYILQVHTGAPPRSVSVNGRSLSDLRPADFEQGSSGWYYAAADRHGIVYVRTDTVSVRDAHGISISVDGTSSAAGTGGYPAKPKGDGTLPVDRMLVINRPAEEPGYPLENAFDGNPATWFRTLRNQAESYGPHEFVLALGDRCVIDGFQIAPRNDKWWQYGQVRRYEIYMSDVNGDWGEPVLRDTLGAGEGMQTVKFAPTAGRVFRFRVLSTHDMESDSTQVQAAEGSFDAAAEVAVKPVTISEFRLLEHQLPITSRQITFLSDAPWTRAECAGGGVAVHRADDGASRARIVLNELNFARGLTVLGTGRVDYDLRGDWQLLRVEAGIDDRSEGVGEVRFQIFGNESMLYDSGPVGQAGIAKMEVDVRGVTRLSLRTVSSGDRVTAAWADPTVAGFAGDRVGP
jgi:alpha-glucosidase